MLSFGSSNRDSFILFDHGGSCFFKKVKYLLIWKVIFGPLHSEADVLLPIVV